MPLTYDQIIETQKRIDDLIDWINCAGPPLLEHALRYCKATYNNQAEPSGRRLTARHLARLLRAIR